MRSCRVIRCTSPVEWPRGSLPLYVWGNGGCSSNGLAHAAYLRQIASQGYVIVALGVPGGGAAAPADGSTDATQASQMIEAIEWAERETARESGPFHRRIDVTRMAVGGHSCGGLQALAVSGDPRIDTTLVLNSGIYNVPGSGRSRVQVDKSQLTRLHGPMLYLTGGPSDVAHPNATDDVARIDRVPVFFGSLPVGHGGTFSAPDGGDWARVSARWLDWQLKGRCGREPGLRGPGLPSLHGHALDSRAEAAIPADRATPLVGPCAGAQRHSAGDGSAPLRGERSTPRHSGIGLRMF